MSHISKIINEIEHVVGITPKQLNNINPQPKGHAWLSSPMDPWSRGLNGSRFAATSESWLFPKDGATFVSEAPYVTVLHGEVHLQSAKGKSKNFHNHSRDCFCIEMHVSTDELERAKQKKVL